MMGLTTEQSSQTLYDFGASASLVLGPSPDLKGRSLTNNAPQCHTTPPQGPVYPYRLGPKWKGQIQWPGTTSFSASNTLSFVKMQWAYSSMLGPLHTLRDQTLYLHRKKALIWGVERQMCTSATNSSSPGICLREPVKTSKFYRWAAMLLLWVLL